MAGAETKCEITDFSFEGYIQKDIHGMKDSRLVYVQLMYVEFLKIHNQVMVVNSYQKKLMNQL